MASSSDWFAKRMGAPVQPAPSYVQPPMAPVPQQFTPQNPSYPTQQEVQPQQHQRPMTSSRNCPGCGSGNYAKVGNSASQGGSFEVFRCYDCGYPVQQTGSGIGSTGGTAAGGPAIPAKQVPTGGFNPTTIIGHI